MWRPMEDILAIWRPVKLDGLERLMIFPQEDGYRVRSVAIAPLIGASYEIDIDKDWRVRSFALDLIDGRKRSYRQPELGRWQDGNGKSLPKFDGCIDIDLSFSPFTNTLPVRRVNFAKGEAHEFSMLWMPSDTLDPIVDRQRYTCLIPGQSFRYEAVDGSFAADVEFDPYGMVRDYPGLFTRVW